MRDKKCNRSSGIGGQAVLEGVMMKNKDDYAVAIRKPDGEIEVEVDVYRGVLRGSRLKQIPFIRGIFNFLDSLILGMKTLNYSASFYEDGEAEETKLDKALNKISGGKAENILMGFTTAFSIVLAIAIFIMLPYFLSSFFSEYVRNASLLAIIEGVIRILIFLGYVVAISLMKDIHRLYQYHGAEHKCINCIEKGRPLTIHNVMRCSSPIPAAFFFPITCKSISLADIRKNAEASSLVSSDHAGCENCLTQGIFFNCAICIPG